MGKLEMFFGTLFHIAQTLYAETVLAMLRFGESWPAVDISFDIAEQEGQVYLELVHVVLELAKGDRIVI